MTEAKFYAVDLKGSAICTHPPLTNDRGSARVLLDPVILDGKSGINFHCPIPTSDTEIWNNECRFFYTPLGPTARELPES
jgi:hypothetical protein